MKRLVVAAVGLAAVAMLGAWLVALRAGGTPALPVGPPSSAAGGTPALPVGPPPRPPTAAEVAAARREVESTVARQPKSYDMRIQAAALYMRAGAYAYAIPHLQAATRLSPRQALAWVSLGDAATLTGRYPLAETSYARAAKLEPANPLAARGRGQLLIAQGKLDAARDVLAAGVAQHPDDAELRRSLGNLYLVLGKARLAAETLAPAVRQVPNSPELHYLLAEAYGRDMHLNTAIQELEAVARLQPEMHEAWGRMGLYLVNLTRFQEARRALERAISLNPAESHYHSVLADSYSLDGSDPGNYDRAVQLYAKSLDLDPRNDKALYAFAMALTRHGAPEDLPKAADLLKRLVAINPRDMNAEFKLAETYRRLGRAAEARTHMARFRTLFEKGRRQTKDRYHAASFEDTAPAHLDLARRALAKGDYKLAETEFRLALEREPGLPDAEQGLAQVRQKLGPVSENEGGAP